MFSVENNKKKISLGSVKFSCDKPICKNLEGMPMWEYLNKTSFNVFLGKPGSGKTTLALSIVESKKVYRNKFDNILLVMPPNSRDSLENGLLIDDDKVYDDLEEIDEILERLQASSAANERTLLILDDVAADLKSSKHIERMLSRIVFNMRHLKTTIFLLVQSFVTMPKNIRKCITNMFVFKLSKNEMEALAKEVFEFNTRQTMQLLKLYDSKHDYLFINVSTQTLFKNQDYVRIQL